MLAAKQEGRVPWSAAGDVDRLVVVVNVGFLGVVVVLVLGVVVMAVDERSMVVLVRVVVRSMLELATETTGMVVRHVVVIVGVDLGRMRVLLLLGLFPHGRLARRGTSLRGVDAIGHESWFSPAAW
jgi:hypothetical protein